MLNTLNPLNLIAFNKLDQIKNKIEIKANLKILKPDLLQLYFSWEDPENNILLAASPSPGRQNNLWKQTCFEAFLRPKNKKSYYEINLSDSKAWNMYAFDSYRNPQPPQEVAAANLLEIQVSEKSLSATINIKNLNLDIVDVSLSAVILNKSGEVSYWSLKHTDINPNFHHQDSFVLERKCV